jgi:hypothetical protein
MDLTNIGYTPTIPEDLNTFDESTPSYSPDNSVFNYFRKEGNSELGVLVKANDNHNNLFSIDKINNNVRIGTLYYLWSGETLIGGEKLTLYGKEGITIVLDNWKSCILSTDDNNFNIKKNENDKITIPYGTDLTNLGTRLSSLEENSEDYLPKVPYKEQIENYLPVFPNWLCTSSNTSTTSPTNYSLFNFFNVKNSGTNYPGVTVIDSNNTNKSLFFLDRSTNDVRLGVFNNPGITTGTVQVGGYELQLYSRNNYITLMFGNNVNTLYGDTSIFQITSQSGKVTSLQHGSTMSYTNTDLELCGNNDSKVKIAHGINLLTPEEGNPLTIRNTKYNAGKDIKIPYGMEFEATDDCLVVTAKTTSGTLKKAKIPWE